ncbi:MAG: class I SAM-dependent methyltransferase [Patescibacteria group bacterium]
MRLPTTAVRARIIADAYAPHIVPGSRAVDIGCGDGIVADLLRRRFDLEITGTDIRNRLALAMPFVESAPRAPLPFAAGAFDLAMLNDVLHHLPFEDQPALIAEALRVARTLLIFEDEPGALIALFDKAVNFFHDKDMPVPLTFRAAGDWRAAVANPDRAVAVRELGRPAAWYPFRHIVIRISDAARSPLQSAIG